MARRPNDKPWFHESSGFFCATIYRKRVYLDRDYKVACRKLKQQRAAERRGESPTRDWLDASFGELADLFLDDINSRRAPGTYRNYRERLLRGMRLIGTDVRVGEFRRFHLNRIEQKMTGDFSPTTIRDTLAVTQQVFSWAVRNDLLDLNPVVGYQKPAGRNRSRLTMPDEFQSLLRHTDACFRRFLIALRMTGCRPGELRCLTWLMVDFEQGLWVIPQHKTITMQREPAPRIIPLPDSILRMCQWLANRQPHQPTDHVFLNMRHRPYTKDCVVTKMSRLRERAGIEQKAGENLVLYTNRHTYATNAIGNVSDTELAALLGHTTTRTLRHYVHLNADRLREIQRRAQG